MPTDDNRDTDYSTGYSGEPDTNAQRDILFSHREAVGIRRDSRAARDALDRAAARFEELTAELGALTNRVAILEAIVAARLT